MESTVSIAEAAVLRALVNEKKLTGNQTVDGNLAVVGDATVGGTVAVTGALAVFGQRMPTEQPAAIADAADGATVDAEARVAINAVLAVLRANGMIATAPA